MSTQKQADYSGMASLLKWGIIGTVLTVAAGGTTYYFIHKSVKDNKTGKENSATLSVNSKGKVSSTVGIGKTPSAYASLIRSALKATNWAGIPDTNEEEVYSLLTELRSQYEVALVSKSYETLFSQTLNQGLTGDLDDDEYSKCIGIVTSKPVK